MNNFTDGLEEKITNSKRDILKRSKNDIKLVLSIAEKATDMQSFLKQIGDTKKSDTKISIFNNIVKRGTVEKFYTHNKIVWQYFNELYIKKDAEYLEDLTFFQSRLKDLK